jgi:hypothetical protein
MGTGSFPGVKSGRGVTLTPHHLLVPWSRKSRAVPLLPLWAVRPVQSLSACTRVHFTLLTSTLYTKVWLPLLTLLPLLPCLLVTSIHCLMLHEYSRTASLTRISYIVHARSTTFESFLNFYGLKWTTFMFILFLPSLLVAEMSSVTDRRNMQFIIWILPENILESLNILKPTGHVMHHQFNIQQLYALPTLYLGVLYLSENKQRLVPLTA